MNWSPGHVFVRRGGDQVELRLSMGAKSGTTATFYRGDLTTVAREDARYLTAVDGVSALAAITGGASVSWSPSE